MIEGAFRGSAAVAAGIVTKNELRGPGYRRLFPDVYSRVGDSAPDFSTLSRAAGLLVADRGGVVGGYSAAALLGADCTPRDCPVEVIAPVDVRRHPGLVVRRGVVTGPDRWLVGDCVVTSPERTAWDLVRRLDLVEGVVAVDALAHLRFPMVAQFAPGDLLRRRGQQPGARGCRRIDRVVELANPLAESPMETRLRLLLVLAGLPTPVVQHVLADRWGSVVARFDLAYPDALLAIEYDGKNHSLREFTRDDRYRDAVTADLGWHTVRFGYQDVLITPERTAGLVARMLQRRSPTSTREWSAVR